MSGIYVPDSGKPVPFKPEKEEGYVYELPDGALVRIKCHLRRRAEILHHELTRHKIGLDKLFNGYSIRIFFRQIPDELL